MSRGGEGEWSSGDLYSASWLEDLGHKKRSEVGLQAVTRTRGGTVWADQCTLNSVRESSSAFCFSEGAVLCKATRFTIFFKFASKIESPLKKNSFTITVFTPAEPEMVEMSLWVTANTQRVNFTSIHPVWHHKGTWDILLSLEQRIVNLGSQMATCFSTELDCWLKVSPVMATWSPS